MSDVFVCPPEHAHAEKRTCHVNHGCRCEPCKQLARDYQRERYQARNAGRTRAERPFPHGTPGGFRRHVKEKTEPCSSCTEARRAQNREMGRRKAEKAAVSRAQSIQTAEVRAEDGRIVIVATPDEARLIAAAVMDRALALEPNRHVASGGAVAVQQTEQIEALRALHKRISTTVRAAA